MRITALHKVNPDHLAEVTAEMRTMGAPTIRVVETEQGCYDAIEGVHRLAAAAGLGMTPRIEVVERTALVADLGLDWQDASPDSTVGDMLDWTDSRGATYDF